MSRTVLPPRWSCYSICASSSRSPRPPASCITAYLIVLGLLNVRMAQENPAAMNFLVITAALLQLIALGALVVGLSLSVLLMGLLVALLVSAYVVSAHRRDASIVEAGRLRQ